MSEAPSDASIAEQNERVANVHLSGEFLDALVAELDSDGIVGIVLGGSYARGEATRYSDVDIACFVKDDERLQPKKFSYRDGRLVSVGTKSIAGARADMEKPNTAIWTIPGISQCRVLLDKDGSVSKLLEDLHAFTWQPLQAAADSYASFSVMLLAETVHKVVNEIVKGDYLAVSYATAKLFSGLTEAVAVQRGVLVKSDNTYYRQAQESAGLDSDWTCYHRLVAGVDGESAGSKSVRGRGVAVLRLYRETVELLSSAMAPEHLEIAWQAARLLDEAGL